MKITCRLLLALLGMTFIVSCTGDESIGWRDSRMKSFTTFTATIGDAAATRAHIVHNSENGKKSIAWDDEIPIAVFSDQQKELTPYELTGEADGVGSFTGEKVTGKDVFYALYPYLSKVECYVDENNPNILHTLLIPHHVSTAASTTNNYRFFAPMVAASEDNNFHFQQTTGMIHVSIGNISFLESAMLRGYNQEKLCGYGYIDLSESSPVFRVTDEEEYVYESFSKVENAVNDGIIDIYFIIPPTDFEHGFYIEIVGINEDGYPIRFQRSYSKRISVDKATIKKFSLINVDAELNKIEDVPGGMIAFADAKVKEICLKYWDTDSDGQLSYGEAAAVSHLNNYFYENRTIRSFNELQYFTGLKTLDEGFGGCFFLQSVTIPKNVELINSGQFRYCDKLSDLKIADGNTNYYVEGNAIIERATKKLVRGFTTTVIPNDVVSIEDGAFNGNNLMTNIIIPEGIRSIGNAAFAYCASLENLTIPASTVKIGQQITTGSRNVQTLNVTAGNPIYYSESNAIIERSTKTLVLGCQNTIIPNDVVNIADLSMNNCNISIITLPKGLKSIGESAFAYNEVLTELVIPASVTLLGEGFASDCNELQRLVVEDGNPVYYSVGNSVIERESMTLVQGCNVSIIPNGVKIIAPDAFLDCKSIKDVILPEGLVTIGHHAFYDCDNLTSVFIPSTINKIDYWAFSWCENLTTVTCMATTPPDIGEDTWRGRDIFGYDDMLSTIYVPATSVDAYKAAEGWSQYADKILPQSENIGGGKSEAE